MNPFESLRIPMSPYDMNPNNSKRWIVLALAVLMQAITIGIATYSFAFFVVPWIEAFGANRGTLMAAATGSTIGSAILSPLCGPFLDRVSSRLLVLIGAGAFALGLIAAALAPNALTIILIFIFLLPFGLVLAGTLMASSLVARAFTQGRGMALGISALGTSAGGLLMPLLVTQVLASYDWRTLFFMLAGIVVIAVVLPALIILKPDNTETAPAPSHSGSGFEFVRSAAVLKTGFAFLAPALLFIAVLHNLGALATDLGISQQHAAWIVSAASVLMAISKLVFGMLSDRVAHKVLYSAALCSQLAGMAFVCTTGGYWSLLAGTTLVAVGAGSTLPIITSFVAGHWGPERFGSVMGVVLAMVGLTGLGSVIAGVIRDYSGSYVFAFAALTLLLVPAALCFLTIPQHVQTPRPAAGTL